MSNYLKFSVTGIGSLPHENIEDAFDDILSSCANVPFLPQLLTVNKFENMTFQFLEKNIDEINKASDKIEDYSISHCSALDIFENYLDKFQPVYAKAQIIGPFTLSMILKDINNTPAYFDDDLKNMILKHLGYKGLWLGEKISKKTVKPIIFIDEPSLGMVGPYSDIKRDDVVDILKKHVKILKSENIVTGIHCCGKCDWSIIIDSGADILSFDAFTYSKDFAEHSDKINEFINRGGRICWGIIPVMSEEILEHFTLDSAYIGFYLAVNYLLEKGLNKNDIFNASMLSTSCGMGNLSVELSKKAMLLTKDLSKKLKEIKI